MHDRSAPTLDIADPEQQRLRDSACRSCTNGVARSHLLSYEREGALLEELFTHDGSGTLIAQNPYELARAADIDDITSIMELIRPLEDSGALVKRSRERLEEEIGYFSILERDGRVLACAALYPYADEGVGEIACVATHPDYRGEGRAKQLLDELIAEAKALSLTHVFVLTTQSSHWVLEQGFEAASLDDLPVDNQQLYNWQRNAAVPTRSLNSAGASGVASFLTHYPETSMPQYRSRTSTAGRNMAGARALWRATGMQDEDFEKPIIAVVNSFTQFVLGHVHLKDRATGGTRDRSGWWRRQRVQYYRRRRRYCHGPRRDALQPPSRDLIADSVECMVTAHCADAMVCISNCDKITPAC